jgi:PAS domain S-box-containing protein
VTPCQPAAAHFDNLAPDFAATLADSGIGLYTYDDASRTFHLDETCRRVFDIVGDIAMSPEVMISRIHPEDLDRYWLAARDAMTTGVFSCEYRVVHRDQSVHFVMARARPLMNSGTGPMRMSGVCIDVTARRTLEEELLVAQERMQDFADRVPGLFSYLDHQYVVRFMSASYDDWYGYSRNRHLHQHIADVVGPTTFVKRKPLYDRCMAGETVTYDEVRRMANGEERCYSVTYHPARADGGEIGGILSLAIDITARRRAEQALEARTLELQRSNHELEQFAYVASHDLKAPLRAIEILVDWLRDDLENYQEGEVQQNLSLLKQRTARLHRLLDDLLAYSRSGRTPGDAVALDSHLLVEDLFALLGPPPHMSCTISGTLPVLRAHAAPLEQVLRNLINNAIKHHPGPSGNIRVYAEDQGHAVLFAVEDDGAGIAPEFAEKVFQMFQTLRPRDEVEGSGMGLAIVKRIVDLQGGRIWFEPAPGGRGTVFKFTWCRLAEGSDTTSSLATFRAEKGLEHYHA